MKYAHIPGVDKPVSRIVQGCTMLRDGEAQSRSNALLDLVFEAGINTFDHAWEYGDGQCERAFGNWLRERRVREDVVIVDKGCHPMHGVNRVAPRYIESELNESLERLGVDTIDLWLLHRDDPTVSVGPLVETLNRMVEAGKISAFGGSNWTRKRIEEANAFANANGLVGFTASSPHFSLAEQIASPWGDDCITISGVGNEQDRDWYAETGLGVLCWSSLAGGFLTGRYSRATVEVMAAELPEYTVRAYLSEGNWTRLERAGLLASEKGVSVAQVAIAYVLHQAMSSFALVRSTTASSIRSNLGALDVNLSDREIRWLDLRCDAR